MQTKGSEPLDTQPDSAARRHDGGSRPRAGCGHGAPEASPDTGFSKLTKALRLPDAHACDGSDRQRHAPRQALPLGRACIGLAARVPLCVPCTSHGRRSFTPSARRPVRRTRPPPRLAARARSRPRPSSSPMAAGASSKAVGVRHRRRRRLAPRRRSRRAGRRS